MICQRCNSEMVEYVGLSAAAGDPNNPWDCPNECKEDTYISGNGGSGGAMIRIMPGAETVPCPDGFNRPVSIVPYAVGIRKAALHGGGSAWRIRKDSKVTYWHSGHRLYRRIDDHPSAGTVPWEALG
jgi:hypothetical protein